MILHADRMSNGLEFWPFNAGNTAAPIMLRHSAPGYTCLFLEAPEQQPHGRHLASWWGVGGGLQSLRKAHSRHGILLERLLICLPGCGRQRTDLWAVKVCVVEQLRPAVRQQDEGCVIDLTGSASDQLAPG